MGRKPPENPNAGQAWPPDVDKQADRLERTMRSGKTETKIIVQTRQYRLITPLFGGGVEPGVNDPDNLIRATEIRGQLRFWWRAIRGGQPEFAGQLDKMKAREDEIWGAASNTKGPKESEEEDRKERIWNGAIQIEVEVQNRGKGKKPFKPQWNDKGTSILAPSDPDIPGYAAFPLRPTNDDLRTAKRLGGPEYVFVEDVREEVVFLLRLSFPQIWNKEVNAALWAWETFGGVGARTRRGFGSLLLEKMDEKDLENDTLPPSEPVAAKAWIKNRILHYQEQQQGKTPAGVPHIRATMQGRILGAYPHPADAWQRLIERLSEFRQKRFDFRLKRPSSFGKSLWPEANALRRRLHPNQPQVSTPDKFPRAAFGLPIVFHLAHESPARTITLQGTKEEGERWASRLILKPLPCQGKRFLGLAILLDGSELPADDLALAQDGQTWKTIAAKQTEIRAGELSGLGEVIGNETDILLAFLNYLKKERY